MEEFKKIYVTTTGGNTAQLAYTDEKWENLSELVKYHEINYITIDNFVFNIKTITVIHRQ